MEVLQAIALTGIIVLILVLIWFALSAKPKVDVILGNLGSMSSQGTQAVANLNQAAKDVSSEAADQKDRIAAEIGEIRKVTADVHDLIIHTDLSLNGRHGHQGVLTAVAKTVQDTDTAVLATTADLHKMTIEAQPVLENASRATASAADTIADHAVRESLDNLAQATQNASQATADASASMKKVRAGVEYEVDQLMKPVRKVKVVGEEIVRLIGKFLGF